MPLVGGMVSLNTEMQKLLPEKLLPQVPDGIRG